MLPNDGPSAPDLRNPASITACTSRSLTPGRTARIAARCAPFVASIALHHIHDLEQKTDLYRAIRKALPPGGPFLNLDAAVSEGPRLSGPMFDSWVAHMVEQGIPEADARGNIASWQDEDTYFPLDTELAALRQAGFSEVECVWRRSLGSICCGLR